MGLFGQEEREPKNAPSSASTPSPSTSSPPNRSPALPSPPPPKLAAAVAEGRAESAQRGEALAAIGRGCRLTGTLYFDGTARIDGQVEGEISVHDTLIVGERAVVTAQITGGTVIVKGRVTGDITASRRVEIHPPGMLFGNIVTPSLVIHDGVVFEGRCSMGTAPLGAADKSSGGETPVRKPVEATK